MKLLVCIAVLFAFAEARLNKLERIQQVFEYVQTNETLMEMYREHLHQHKIARERYHKHVGRTSRAAPFTCLDGYTLNPTLPTSVHQLRPEHISVTAALGDSLTAGNGILGTNILDCLTEYRGRSWSIGGDLNFDQGVETLPNILKKYSHHVKGYSLGKCDTSNEGCSQLNVAVAGATSQELPAQAHELVRRLHHVNYGIDLQNEWKLITVFIGGNDLCDYCHNSNTYSPANYVAKIEETLQILYDNVPRAFVNLVEIFDIKPLAKVSQGFFCNLVTSMVCDCAKDQNNNMMLTEASHQYQERVQNLIASGKFNDKNDFAVVLQPFFRDTEPVKDHAGSYDLAYFAPDCFHFSDLGTNAAAKSLWNNMIEPVASKQTVWHLGESFHCPHTHFQSDGVFRTYSN